LRITRWNRREAVDAAEAAIKAERELPRLRQERKLSVQRIVERVAGAEHDDRDVVEHMAREAGERLEQDDVYGLMSRPFSEVVALICEDLDLNPDWPELAKEAWAKAEVESGRAAPPLMAAAGVIPFPAPPRGTRIEPAPD
jgi:hypothetical protein